MIDVRIDAAAGIAIVRIRGELGPPDYFRAVQQMMDSPGFQPGMGAVWDLREATVPRSDPATLQEMARHNLSVAPQRGQSWRVAILVGSDAHEAGARLFRAYAGWAPCEIAVVRDVDEAIAWARATGRPVAGNPQ